MHDRKTSGLASWIVLCFAPILVCCREHRQTFQVEVPAGFHGSVSISCGAYGRNLEDVNVDATGSGSAEYCSPDAVDVLVKRNGQAVTVGSMQWLRTGDGIPTALEFNVP